MRFVKESPVWLERQRLLKNARTPPEPFSFASLFGRDLRRVTAHSMLVMASLLFLYNALTWWYPTFLSQSGRVVLPFMMAFNVGAVVGAVMCGRLSETSLGRRGAAGLATLIGIAAIPIFLFTTSTPLLLVGAGTMGFFGTGNFGIVPGYLTERFPTASRAVGAGFAYQSGAAIASVGPTLIGTMTDRGMALNSAMAICIAIGGALVIFLLWLGPETRGRTFEAVDAPART